LQNVDFLEKSIMNVEKYRKWYLSENWGDNRFKMIIFNIGIDNGPITHGLVLSKQAFWVNEHTLCIGYRLCCNPNIYRPIFSHARQRLLDKVHKDIINPAIFWRKIKQRYYLCLSKVKKIPLECVIHIIHYIR